jgi:peptidoglycan/xylan/chitin deacetylase (PgdA/CDA1 family)
MNKRDLAASILGSGLGSSLMRPLSRIKSGELCILAWHRVGDDDPLTFQFDDDLISATTGEFRRQMQFLRRNFDVISFRDLDQLESEGRPLPRRALIITFDDGYRDNYTRAFPILKELGLPATIFLATGHIGQTRLFWWDQVAYCLKQTERQSVRLPEFSDEPVALLEPAARRNAIERIQNWLKQQPEEARRSFVNGLGEALEVELPPRLAEGMHLTWDEVKDMAAHGIEFGSHTVTHPILANVSEPQLAEEIAGSKRAIEARLGREVIAFAYPAGRRSRFNQAVCRAVAEHGYRYAVAFDEGIVADLQAERFTLPRIHVERNHSLSLFRANLLFPRLMFGRNGH